MPDHQTLTRTRIVAEILQIRFQNPDSGFAVVRVLDADKLKFTAAGVMPGIEVGQTIEAGGYFEKHPDYGEQFRVDELKIVPPCTEEGIARFLAFAVPGIGQKTAELIVKTFGRETSTILDLYPKRLREVPKIGPKKAAQIAEGWKKSQAKRHDMIFLQGLGITPAYCARLFKTYGEEAVAKVRENPYQLSEDVNGIGFVKADAIAMNMGFRKESVIRMEAAVAFTVNECLGEGHVCIPEAELLTRAAALTSQPEAVVKQGIQRALERQLLFCLDGFYYTPLTAAAETRLPKIISTLAEAPKFAGQRLKAAISDKLTLDIRQQEAVLGVRESPLSIITGGPGVGKTTVIGEIVRQAHQAGVKLALAAPTGRAAKRLGEAAQCEAKTIHRLLQFDPVSGTFVHRHNNPLKCEMLIVDEVSMLDIILAYQLFQAIPPGSSVILVGDADQLPSVGPGRVLPDLIDSGFFNVVKLTKIFRQGNGSRIVVNAHSVNEGKLPELRSANQGEIRDFYWIEQENPEKVMTMIEAMVCRRIPQSFGYDPIEDIQVLTPMNRGECGTAAINEKLAEQLRKPEVPFFMFGSRKFSRGDKVMQISNNYEKNVFNGDMGRISSLDPEKKSCTVIFDERPVEYDGDEMDQLVLAYAITIHKSQGSEFPAVIIPLLTQHYVMLQRNLIYTGMTRAKKLLILIGSVKALKLAVNNTRIRMRYTRLLSRFAALRPTSVGIKTAKQ